MSDFAFTSLTIFGSIPKISVSSLVDLFVDEEFFDFETQDEIDSDFTIVDGKPLNFSKDEVPYGGFPNIFEYLQDNRIGYFSITNSSYDGNSYLTIYDPVSDIKSEFNYCTYSREILIPVSTIKQSVKDNQLTQNLATFERLLSLVTNPPPIKLV